MFIEKLGRDWASLQGCSRGFCPHSGKQGLLLETWSFHSLCSGGIVFLYASMRTLPLSIWSFGRELDLILQFLECPFYHTNSQQQLAVLCSTQNTLTPQSLFSVNYFFSVLQQSWPFSVSHYMFFFQGLFPWKILPPKHKIRKGYKEDGRVLRKQWNYNNIRKERHLCWNQS